MTTNHPPVQHENDYYRIYQPRFLCALIGAVTVAIVWTMILMLQIYTRPLPVFYATQPDGHQIRLQPQNTPSLKAETIIAIATKGAVASYTFDFVNYKQQIGLAQYYFTASCWKNYLASIAEVINTVKSNKLFIYAVVNGAPIIARQGVLDGVYTWEVQLPFLVTYQSAQTIEKYNFTIIMRIVAVNTNVNPIGIGIDSLNMVSA